MPNFLLHGLWLAGSGLNLWVEQVQGHRVITMDKVPDGTFPPAAHAMLTGALFRHREQIRLQTPRGKEVLLMAPTTALAPSEAVRLLAALVDVDTNSPSLTEEQRTSVAPDLAWLIRMYRGLDRFAGAGRVSIHVPLHDGAWYAEWQLGTGVDERGWLAEMIAAAPGVLIANNGELGEDMARTLMHAIVTARLDSAGAPKRESPYGRHDFINSLLSGAPIRRGSALLSRKVGDWNGSITAVNLQLVFIAGEPLDTPAAELNPANTLWPVRVQVRSGSDAPRPVRLHDYDSQTAQKLRADLARAVEASPLLDTTRHARAGEVPRTGEEGDWDVYLTNDEIARFVATEASKLRMLGYAVMLPKSWTTAETKAKLHVRRASDPHDSSTKRYLGFDTLMSYDWRVSVGGVELSDEEMAQLVRSKSGLVKLRDEWVLADTSELARTQRYIEKLRKHAEPGSGGDDGEGLITAGELRQLALEAAGEHAEAYGGALGGTYGGALGGAFEMPWEIAGEGWAAALVGGLGGASAGADATGADATGATGATGLPAPERVRVPNTVQANLRDYQRRGVDWLYYMSRSNLGAVLADDMGLGKTLQLLTLLAVEEERGEKTGPTLVVAPTSVVGNWAREAGRFVPSMRVVVHHGGKRRKERELFEDADLVITSYGVVNRDHAELAEVEWDHLVLDEAQAIKNAGTQAARSVRAIPARHRIALTGTPIENKLSELRSLLDFVNPGMLGSQAFFRNHFAKPIERGEDDVLAAEMSERLKRLTAPFILRRLKTDPAIIDDLPDKAEHVLTVDMTPEQAALYTALTEEMQQELEKREGMQRRGLILSTITRIKQICNHPAHFLGDGSPVTILGRHRSGKVARLVEILDGAAESGQRVLIFTQYKAFGDILQPYLSGLYGEEIPFLHGGVGKARRDAMVELFQRIDGPPAMLLSLKAGGTGLNLTAASIVVHMDRWWNPAVENQATDRAFRIGQERDVTVYKMVTRGTMEERIQEVLDGKMQLAGVVGEGEGWITELGADDLAKLLSFRGHRE